MTDILREESPQNTQVEMVWLHTWGKSLRIYFFLNLSFIETRVFLFLFFM